MIGPHPTSFAEMVGLPRPLVPGEFHAHGTTVLSLRYNEGVLTMADRRATMGNLVMYDQAEKVVPLDDWTVIAISGSFARSVEICRYLRHSFKYYSRMHLADMSLHGKLQEITRALAGNLQAALEGIGAFLPIAAAYDRERDAFGIYFFDGAGARFRGSEYACAGSGSERIRGVFEYVTRVGKSWDERPLDDVLLEGMRMLDIASDLDAATGGFTKVLPAALILDRTGTREVPQETLRESAERVLAG